MATATKQLPNGRYSFSQLEGIWIQAGGPRRLASTMAAIALAESGGNPYAHNGNSATGDDSYGLWQINYYGNLRDGRTREFGPPESMYNPVNNAAAALKLASSPPGLYNWSTFKNGAWKSYIPSGTSVPKWGSPGGADSGPGHSPLPIGLSVHPLSDLEKAARYVMYGFAFVGAAMVILTGLVLIGADLGLALFAGRAVSKLPSVKAAGAVRRNANSIRYRKTIKEQKQNPPRKRPDDFVVSHKPKVDVSRRLKKQKPKGDDIPF